MWKTRFGVRNQSDSNVSFYINCFFFKYISLLNHVGSTVKTIFIGILVFVIVHIFTFIEIVISPYGFKLISSVLSFYQDFLEHFLQGRSCGHKVPQLLFIWECLDCSLTLERSVCPDTGFLFDSVFFLFPISTLTISTHCFMVSKVSDEKSTDKSY